MTAKTEEKNSTAGFTGLDSVYLATRSEWYERNASLKVGKQNWQRAAFGSLLIALVAVSGCVYMATRSHIQPFVVLVDSLARPVAYGFADSSSPTSDTQKRVVIADWVEKMRMVTPDPIMQRKAIDQVYAQISHGSAAQVFVTEFYRSHQPYTRSSAETVSADVIAVLPTTAETYQVDWTETTRDLYGTVKSVAKWKGSFVVSISKPDEVQARINPLGVYVTNASWSQVRE